ncbi:hypothetical protein GUJ93_ZPchr0002g25513 [Zizania palustris]|uniref:Uncharacterized protein n=1 Tax=Zizania palustris TaxID=103762 RepID=A0A8J5RU90_ZIZPA|nr:hypothetical protein GUJ93_ZPchr0002g25513 [Zizania palustris]
MTSQRDHLLDTLKAPSELVEPSRDPLEAPDAGTPSMEERTFLNLAPEGGLEVAPSVVSERSEPEAATTVLELGALEVATSVLEPEASQTHKRDLAGLFVASECPELSLIDEENEDTAEADKVRLDDVDLEGSSRDSGSSSNSSSSSSSEESNEDPSDEGATKGLAMRPPSWLLHNTMWKLWALTIRALLQRLL